MTYTNATVSAPLFAFAACATASSDRSRDWVRYVAIQPAPNGEGVLLVGSDGATLLCAHDPEGSVGLPASRCREPSEWGTSLLILPEKPLLAFCKSQWNDRGERRLRFTFQDDPIHGRVQAGLYGADEDGTPVLGEQIGIAAATCDDPMNCFYPDFTHVVPTSLPENGKAGTAMYAPDRLKCLIDAAGKLGHHRKGEPFRISVPKDHDPAYVEFLNHDNAFGVVMPMRCDKAATPPDWFRPVKTQTDAA